MKLTLRDVARIIGAEIVGPEDPDSVPIRGVAQIESAGEGEVTFVAARRYEQYLETTQAAAVIVTPEISRERRQGAPDSRLPAAMLEVRDPYRAFIQLLGTFGPSDEGISPGIHPTAVVPASARIDSEARIGAYAVLGERVTIGAGTQIWPHAVLGNDVTVGEDCRVYPNVTVREGCHLGNRVVIHPGAVIGADGFGFLPSHGGRREKVPQVGTVRIEDDVEIGANTTIDRATVQETVLRRGVKIDNLVQIAHNVEVGADTCIAAQTGVSGSTRIGARNLIAGQVGFVDHSETCDDVIVIAQAGVAQPIKKPGIYSGVPVMDHGDHLRLCVALRRLPDALTRLRALERRLAALEKTVVEADETTESSF